MRNGATALLNLTLTRKKELEYFFITTFDELEKPRYLYLETRTP
jgi:hypothetical protein